MSAEVLFGLIFIAAAMFGHLILTAIHYGLFDMIIVRLNNYILSRIERLEKDI